MNDHLHEAFGQCSCGSGWFELAVPEDAEGPCGPAVCVDTEGQITGYAGKLVCIDCGVDWNPHVRFRPGRGHLQVVEWINE